MRRGRVRPTAVVALVVCSVIAVWGAVLGLPLLLGSKPLKRTPHNIPIAETFTPREYAQFRAEYPQGRDPLDEYVRQALQAGRESDAIRAVEPENVPYAWEQVTFDLIGKAGSNQWPKVEAKHGSAVRRLRVIRPHSVAPYTAIIDGFLLFCDGKFDKAEAAFAALPAGFLTRGYQRGTLWLCRLTGFQQRGHWREAYQTLVPRRQVFHILGNRLLEKNPVKVDELEELIRLHREGDPDDLLLPYYSAQVRYHQWLYDEVLEPSAEFIHRSLQERDDRLDLSWWYYHEAMWHRHAVSLALLGRVDEAEDYVDQLIEKLPDSVTTRHQIAHLQNRVRLAIALRRGDVDDLEKLLASDPDAIWLAHFGDHFAPLFWHERFTHLREKYPPPER